MSIVTEREAYLAGKDFDADKEFGEISEDSGYLGWCEDHVCDFAADKYDGDGELIEAFSLGWISRDDGMYDPAYLEDDN